MSLSLDHHVEDSELHIRLAGVIDLVTRPLLVNALEAAFDDPGLSDVVVDIAGVTFMDCYGMSALIQGRVLAEKRSLGYRVRNATGIPRTVMEMTGVLDYLCGSG